MHLVIRSLQPAAKLLPLHRVWRAIFVDNATQNVHFTQPLIIADPGVEPWKSAVAKPDLSDGKSWEYFGFEKRDPKWSKAQIQEQNQKLEGMNGISLMLATWGNQISGICLV